MLCYFLLTHSKVSQLHVYIYVYICVCIYMYTYILLYILLQHRFL